VNDPSGRAGGVDPHIGKEDSVERWQLKLYIAGMNQTARRAINNLEKICVEHLEGRYTLEIIDLLEHPQLAEGDQIIAVPTLVRSLPPPIRKILGDLSEKEKVFIGLDIRVLA
jgi:circadian clock protein KaiB